MSHRGGNVIDAIFEFGDEFRERAERVNREKNIVISMIGAFIFICILVWMYLSKR